MSARESKLFVASTLRELHASCLEVILGWTSIRFQAVAARYGLQGTQRESRYRSSFVLDWHRRLCTENATSGAKCLVGDSLLESRKDRTV